MRKFTPNLPEFHRENSLFDNNYPVYYTIKGNKWKKPAYFFHGSLVLQQKKQKEFQKKIGEQGGLYENGK